MSYSLRGQLSHRIVTDVQVFQSRALAHPIGDNAELVPFRKGETSQHSAGILCLADTVNRASRFVPSLRTRTNPERSDTLGLAALAVLPAL